MSDKRVGKRFQEYREKLGLSQHDLATKLGLSDNYISAIECGNSFPGYKNLIALLNELEASPNVILGDVLNHEVDGAVSPLTEKLDGLPEKEKTRIMQIVEFLVEMTREELAKENEKSGKGSE